MAITRDTTLAELAGLVSEKLKHKGLSAILVGGAVVSIYSDNRYESGDLDFVIEQFMVPKGLIETAMGELGFTKSKARVYLHEECRYAIDFSSPPAAIGEERIENAADLKVSTGRLKLFTPTQSVMDRLSAYYHFDDRQGLEQALLVASEHPVNLRKIREWSVKEGMETKHADFEKALKKAAKKSR